MSTLAEQQTMIADCITRESRMTDWEREFIQSISEYSEAGGFLSDKQDAILDKIWNKVTEKG